eukprot:Lithocolla_globosa_v1_NODE_19_length_9697_cov_21.310620.p2 type:complete len:445 gc:universal NODE_19_length_9697_cov_21.310620:1929-3263(+)
MSVIAQELDYSSSSVSHGTYQFSKTTPLVALAAADSITTSGGQESIFELPSKAFNLERSVLSFSATPVSGTLATKTFWSHTDGFPYVRQIQVYTKEGLYLCDIQDAHKYCKMTMRRFTKFSDITTSDTLTSGAAAGGYFTGLYPSRTAITGTSAIRPSNVDAKTPYWEPAYCLPGVQDDIDAPIVNIQIPLSRIANSIFLDRDMYFGESIYIRLVWAPTTQVLFKATTSTDPSTGAGVSDSNLTISDLLIYLAVEQNPVVVQSLMDKYKSGSLSFNIPFVYMNIQSLTGTQHNLQVRYSRPHGKKLKAILWTPFNATDTLNNAYDTDNKADAKVLDYYTMVNSVRLTQFNYDTSTGNDWMYYKEKLSNSCILSSDEFYYNWSGDILFSGGRYSDINNANLDDGLDLSEEVKIDIQATTAGALKHMIYAVTLKTLNITPTGITLS